MTSVCILGAAGRMGQALIRSAQPLKDLRIVAAVEVAQHPALGQDAGVLAAVGPVGVRVTPADEAVRADVVIDFTAHTGTAATLARTVAARQALVLGTTGLDAATQQAVREAARQVAIVQAPNMSLGVNVLLDLVRRAASILDPSYDIEVVEMHHNRKQDAPSGTALGLAAAAAKGRAVELERVAAYGRHGIVGPRPRGEIALHALRGGDVVGDHTVIFAADGERVELAHKASNRESFAKGALRAAAWLHGREPGLYSMRDVLGLD